MGEIKKIITSLVSPIPNNNLRLSPILIIVVGIMPLAILLTFLFLGQKSLWWDEAFTVQVARMDWGNMWHILSQYEANQGLYYILLHLWMNLVGQSEFALRSISVIFALVTVVLVYIIGNKLFGSRVGIIAALLITINSLFIAFAQEVRAYELALLLSTLASFFFVKAIESSSWKWWLAYIFSITLGVYAHFYVSFIFAAHLISTAFLPRREPPWKGLLPSIAAVVVLLIPLIIFVLTRDVGQIDYYEKPQLGEIVGLFHQLTGRGGVFLMLAYFIPCLIALFFAVRNWQSHKTSPQLWRYVFLLSWALVPVVLSFSFSLLIKPIFGTRYHIVSLSALVLFVAIGLCHLKPRWLFFSAMAVLVVLSCVPLVYWYTNSTKEEYFTKENWRGAANYIVSSMKPGDAIVYFSPMVKIPFDYYFDQLSGLSDVPTPVYYCPSIDDDLNVYYYPDGLTLGRRLPDPDKSLIDSLEPYNRVWLVLSYDVSWGRNEQRQR
jgi:mannosyltransferase